MEELMLCPSCGRKVPKSDMARQHVRPRFLDKTQENRAFLKVCRECDMLQASKQYADYLVLSVSRNTDTYKSFLESVYEIEALASTKLLDKKLSIALDRILFAAAITAMETYLSDTLINRVAKDESLVQKCAENIPELRDKKLTLGELYRRKNELPVEVRDHLLGIVYHNLAKIKPMYRSVLGVEFREDMDSIFKAVEQRHDVVHRGGKSKEGLPLQIEGSDVNELLNKIKWFISEVDRQLQ